MIRSKKNLACGIIIYFLAALIQLISFIVYQNGIISRQNKTSLLFVSVFIAAFADICIIKSISHKIIKIFLSMHAIIALIGSVIFFITLAID